MAYWHTAQCGGVQGEHEKMRLLAEKVEADEVFKATRAAGCTLFQGYFFAKPSIMLEHSLTSLRINYLLLIREITHSNVNFAAGELGILCLRHEVKSIH